MGHYSPASEADVKGRREGGAQRASRSEDVRSGGGYRRRGPDGSGINFGVGGSDSGGPCAAGRRHLQNDTAAVIDSSDGIVASIM